MNRKARLNYIHAMSTQVEHKKMYKAKKQWVVAGLSFLVATGLGVVGGQLTTHADTTNGNGQQITSAIPKLASGSSNVSNQKSSTSTNSMKPSVASNSNVKQPVSSNGIQHRAEALHSQIVLNKVNNTSVNNSGSSAVSSSAIGKQTAPASSASAKSNVSASASGNVKHGLGAMCLNAQAQSTPQATDNNWIWTKDGYKSVNQFNDWISEPQYWSLNWKYSPTAKAAIFSGTTGSMNNFDTINSPNKIKDLQSIKFDNINMTGHWMNGLISNPNVKSIDFGAHIKNASDAYMSYMFGGDSNLVSLQFSPEFRVSSKNTQGIFSSNTSLQSITLPTFTNKVSDMSYMFQYDKNLKNINFPSTFDSSHVKSMSSMFMNTGFQHLTLPSSFNTQNVRDMSSMFEDTPLQTLNLPPTFTTNNVRSMSNMFVSCGALQGLDLSSFDTSNVRNMSKMFYGDRALTSLNLGNNFDTSDVNDMSNMFSDCFSLPTINLGSKFDTSNVSDMQHMFDSDYALQNLNLGNKFNTNGVKNMYMMFIRDGVHNPNGTNLNLGNEFTTHQNPNMSDMFQYANLHSITMPSTAKFNAKSQLGNSWYPVEKGTDYTVPNAPKTNLMDSGSHQGTWVKNPNVQKVTDTVAFTDSNTSDLVGSTTAYGALDSSYTINKAPQGYSFVGNDNKINITDPSKKVTVKVSKNSNTTTNADKNVPVAPNQDTDTIDYQYNNVTKGSQQFSGNDQHATDAGDTFIDVDSKAATKMPTGYQLVSKDNKFNYDNGTHNVAIAPIQQTDNIQFMNNGKQVGTTTTKGNDSRTGINGNSTVTLPTGYQLAKGASATVANDGTTHQINVTPVQKTDTIDYQLDGVTKGSHQFTGNDVQANGATGTSFDVTSTNDPDIPSGYQLVSPNNQFNYDGGTHNVAIEDTDQSAKVNYNLPNGTTINTGSISGTVNGKTTPNKAPQGYHFSGSVAPYTFTTANAGNNPSDNVTVAPNTLTGTAVVHVYYNLGNGNKVDGGTHDVTLNGHYGQSDIIVDSTQYCPMNDAYQDNNFDWVINVNDLTKDGNSTYNLVNGKQPNQQLNHTFTYDATEAPDLVIRYDLIDTTKNDKLVQKDIHSDTFTASDLGIKQQDWVNGNTITLGTKKNGDTNKLDVINAPAGYHLVDNANGYDYKNTKESIQLEPNATDSKGNHIILMTMPTGNVAPNSKSNKPAKPASNASGSASNAASISMNSSELSSLAKDIGGDINVTVRPNVTNTTNTIDDTTLNSLASEVATNNQEISSLANKPISTANTINVNYSYFDNLINNGVDKLTKAINQDFKANLHNVHAQRTHKVTVKRVRKHIKWIMIMKPVKLYNKATLVGTKHGVKTLKPNHEITLNVRDVYKVHNHYVFKVNYEHHNYYITANHNYVRNSYLPLNHNIINRKVRVLNDVYGYRHKNYNKVKTYHKGFVGKVKNIVKLGHYNMTRIRLTNGLWISANKNFIKLV